MEDEQLNPKFIEYTFKDDVKVKININELLKYKSSILSDATIFFNLLGINKESPYKKEDQTSIFKRWEIKHEQWILALQFIRNGIIFELKYKTKEKFNLLRDFNGIFQIPSLNRYLDEYIEKIKILDNISFDKEISYNPMNPREDYLKKYLWKKWSGSGSDSIWSVCESCNGDTFYYRKLIE